ncbi:hypothetical protein DPEC_G00375180 [Dallia pectoralis]|nr:hypothetical protein DPEC_G00375180 [Dallia pectoralis]
MQLAVAGTATSFGPGAGVEAPRTRLSVSPKQPRNVSTAGQSPKSIHMEDKNVSTPGKGLFKAVTAHWRHAEKKTKVVRSSSTGTTADKGRARGASSERFPKRRSFDPLAALTLPDQTPCTAPLEETHLAKPSNCRRIVVLGAPTVGKTNLIRRFLRDGFEGQYEPTAEDFHRKLYQIRGETYQIDILDAARERHFPARRRLTILTGDIFLLVFSVQDRESFKEVIARRKEIITAKTKLMKLKENPKVPIVICANKIDLMSADQRVVGRSEMRQALGDDAELFETSAKDGTSLEEMFEVLARIGGLPAETRPSQHRKMSIRTYQALGTTGTSSGQCGRRSHSQVLEEPCGAVYPLARRPSFNSDLQRVMTGPSPTKRSRPIEKCQIQ